MKIILQAVKPFSKPNVLQTDLRKMKTSQPDIPINEEFLNNIKKENSFAVPDGYFDTLPETILEKCMKNQKANSKNYFIRNPRFYFPFFTAIAMLVVIFYILKNHNSDTIIIKGSQQFVNVSDKYFYLENLIENNELDESLIIEVIADDTSKVQTPVMIDPTELQNAMLQISGDSTVLTKEDIIQYLLEEEELSDDPYYNN